MENNKILSSFHPTDNQKMSDLNGLDLLEFLILLNDYLIEYRDNLGLDATNTFGVELEFEHSNNHAIKKILNREHESIKTWTFKPDQTLFMGAEISSTILYDKKENWTDLFEICNILQKNAIIGANCGGHVHVGTQVLGDESKSWLNFIKIWSTYENIIFRYGYNEFLCGRSGIKTYGFPVKNCFYNAYKKLEKSNDYSINDILKYVRNSRHQAVNFNNVENDKHFKAFNTIEFRNPNGTLNPTIWQNNINLFLKLLNYCTSNKYNEEIINRREHIYKNKYEPLYFYNQIFLEQSLEFVDLIFDNNLDKINFLKQYLKNFEFASELEVYEKTVKLTKTI